MGLFAGYFALLPHVDVVAKGVINASNPFSVALEVTNRSYFTLQDVQQKCEILHATMHGYIVGRTLNAQRKAVASQMLPNHSEETFCNIDLDTPPNLDATMQVIVWFRLWRWSRRETFRFVYKYGTNGMFWFPSSN